jgi:diaminopimelate decarboxylase
MIENIIKRLLCRASCQLPFELWDVSSGQKGHMKIQGFDCISLAERYSTPLHVISNNKLEKNYLYFDNSFRKWYPRIEIYYSYKTNPIPGVIRAIHELGAGAEVVSPYELQLALTLGVSPDRIIYNGPGKSLEGLSIAVSNNIKLINIDGQGEIETIDRLARQYGHKQKVGLRVIGSVGWKSKFGFTIDNGDAFRAYQRINELQNIIPCGLHFHLGTNIADINVYLRVIKDAIDLSIHLKKVLGINLKYFDIGGGFNIPTVRSFSRINKLLGGNYLVKKMRVRNSHLLVDYGQAITELFGKYYPPNVEEPPTIILEPGRAITSSAQSLLLKVLDVKPPKNGLSDVILDGGNNFAVPLNFEEHEVFSASNMKKPPDKYYRLYGPLCTPGDVLFQIKRLPLLEPGDILAIMDAGAYFSSMQSNFCFFPKPSAVLLKDLGHELIRKRETLEDLIAQDFLGQLQHSSDRSKIEEQQSLL